MEQQDFEEETPQEQPAEPSGEPPVPAESEAPAAPPEPAPEEPVETDYARHIWLLVIVLGVVVAAWFISVLGKRAREGVPGVHPAPQPAASAPAVPPAQRRPTAPPPQAATGPTPVPVARIVGAEAEIVFARPPTAVAGVPHTMARYFNVTEKVESFDLQRLARMPGLYADVRGVLDPAQMSRSPFLPAVEAAGLAARDRVIAVRAGEEVRAYPVKLLAGVGGVSDTIGARPVFVRWAALAQAACALLAELDGQQVEWRDAGIIHGPDPLIYDEGTGSLWDPISGRALAGPLAGTQAQPLEAAVWPWEAFAQEHPDAAVLALGLGAGGQRADLLERGAAIQEGYLGDPEVHVQTSHFDPAQSPLPAKAFVLGLALDGESVAYALEPVAAAAERTFTDTVAGRRVEVRATSGRTAYALVDGEPGRGRVMLWFAWKERHPETALRGPSAGPATRPAQQPAP